MTRPRQSIDNPLAAAWCWLNGFNDVCGKFTASDAERERIKFAWAGLNAMSGVAVAGMKLWRKRFDAGVNPSTGARL